MRRRLLAFALALVTMPLFAQSDDRARTLEELNDHVNQFQRNVMPALAAAQEQAHVLGLMSKIQKRLMEQEPRRAVDDSLDDLDEFVRREENLSDDSQRRIAQVKQWLLDTRFGPALTDAGPVREKIHHEVVHVLQRQVARSATQIAQMTKRIRGLTEMMQDVATGMVNSIGAASPEGTKQ